MGAGRSQPFSNPRGSLYKKSWGSLTLICNCSSFASPLLLLLLPRCRIPFALHLPRSRISAFSLCRALAPCFANALTHFEFLQQPFVPPPVALGGPSSLAVRSSLLRTIVVPAVFVASVSYLLGFRLLCSCFLDYSCFLAVACNVIRPILILTICLLSWPQPVCRPSFGSTFCLPCLKPLSSCSSVR